tara:strand:- start:3466 stop:3852 length:387 start_codon:yes stop_codon:yes gene_type:complete
VETVSGRGVVELKTQQGVIMKSAKEAIRLKSLQMVGCRSRESDPETSKIAAESHKPKSNTNAFKVLETVESSDEYLTGGEIAVRCGLEHIEAARRLSDLCKAGLITKQEVRKCSVKGTKMLTWGAGLQ